VTGSLLPSPPDKEMSSTEPSVPIINAMVIENSTTEPPLHSILTVLNLLITASCFCLVTANSLRCCPSRGHTPYHGYTASILRARWIPVGKAFPRFPSLRSLAPLPVRVVFGTLHSTSALLWQLCQVIPYTSVVESSLRLSKRTKMPCASSPLIFKNSRKTASCQNFHFVKQGSPTQAAYLAALACSMIQTDFTYYLLAMTVSS